MKEELRFINDIRDRLFKSVVISVAWQMIFILKSELTETVSKTLVDKSFNPYKLLLVLQILIATFT